MSSQASLQLAALQLAALQLAVLQLAALQLAALLLAALQLAALLLAALVLPHPLAQRSARPSQLVKTALRLPATASTPSARSLVA